MNARQSFIDTAPPQGPHAPSVAAPRGRGRAWGRRPDARAGSRCGAGGRARRSRAGTGLALKLLALAIGQ